MDDVEEIGTLNDIVSKSSSEASEIVRKICFALFALDWVLVYHDYSVKISTDIFISVFILITYFSLDIAQYLYTTFKYRYESKNINLLNKDLDHKAKAQIIRDYNLEKIEKFLFFIFSVKMFFAVLSVVSVIVVLSLRVEFINPINGKPQVTNVKSR